MNVSQTKLVYDMKDVLGEDGITKILSVIHDRLVNIAEYADQAHFRKSLNHAIRFVFSFYGETDNTLRFLKMLTQTENKAIQEKLIDMANWDEDVRQVFVEKYRPEIKPPYEI